MMRTVALVSLLLAVAVAALGCDVGEVPGVGPDGGLPGGPDAGQSALQCRPAAINNATGHHNQGLGCLDAACHAAGGGGPRWTVGGTLYTTIQGTAPNNGATITIRDANGVILDLIASQNGNFWTNQDVVFPVTTFASKCPGKINMVSLSATGDCNSAGCHSAVGGAGRVYLP